MGTKRAALYLRQSLDRGEGIDAQRQRCTALAAARGWAVVAVFDDNETRASKPRDESTGWGQMLPRIGRDFDVIVSVDLDRLLRSTKDLNTLIDLGAQIVTVDGEIDLASADGEFRATMLAGIGRFETRRASERQKRHKAAKAARGEWHGGIPPYGYKLDPEAKTLVANPAEVKLIHEAATRLLDRGQSLHSIIVEWNNRGERTRKGHHWRQTGLRPILLNRSMLGETVAGVPGWEPIIEATTFERLTSLLTDPSRKVTHSPGANGGTRSMGGGLTRCGLCGKPLISYGKTTGSTGKDGDKTTASTRDGSSVASLACLARVHGPDAENHPRVCRLSDRRDPKRDESGVDTKRVSITHDPLEELVFERVIAMLTDTERWKARMQEKSPEAETQLVALETQRDKLRAEQEGVGMSVMVGAWDERRARAEMERIKSGLEDVNSRINAILERPMLDAVIQGGKLEDWRDWPVIDKRSFLRLFIERVEVYPFPDGARRTRRKLKTETREQFEAAKWDAHKVAASSRVTIRWKWEQEIA